MRLLVFHVLFNYYPSIKQVLVNQCKIWKFYRTGEIFLILKYCHRHLYIQLSRTNLNYTIYHAWLLFVDPLQWREDLCCCFFTFGISAHSWFTKYVHKEFFFFKNSITPRFGCFFFFNRSNFALRENFYM